MPTTILARFVETPPPDSSLAAALYSGMFFYVAILFNALFHYASADSRLTEGFETPRAAKLRNSFGPALYLISLGLAFVNVTLSLVIYVILLVYFAWPTSYLRPKVTQPALEEVAE